MTDQEQRKKWQQDESRWRWAFGLLLTALLATFSHTAVGVWWAAGVNEKVANLEISKIRELERLQEQSARHRDRITTLTAELSSDRILAARIDQRLATMEQILRDLSRNEGK